MGAHAAPLFFRGSLVILPVMLALGGCGNSPADSSQSLASRVTLDVPADAEDTPAVMPPATTAPPASTDLASLAERDVSDFLRLQRDGANAAATGDDARSAAIAETAGAAPDRMLATKADAPAQPPAIIWTDPVGRTLLAASNNAEQPAEPASASETTTADDASTANEALAIPGPTLEQALPEARLNELLVGLSAELYMRASDADQPLRELIMISATSMVDPSRKLANIDALPGLTDRERELLAAFQDFFLELGSKLDGSEEADQAIIAALQQLQTSVVKPPMLTIPAAALCTSVEGFGKYSPFSENRFLAHAGQQMVVYVEIDDFACTQNPAGQWVTELAQQLVIYSDSDGIPVWREDWLPVVDTASKPRKDFYTTQLVTIPDALSVGKYQLKVRLRDERSGAEAEQSIPFEMVADPKMAARR